MKAKKFHKEHLVWLGLLLMTWASFVLGDRSGGQASGSQGWVLLLMGAKFWGIGHFFMELEEAHLFWKVLVYGLLLSLLLGFYILR
ncbi:hypothetical protein L6R29_11465 [Myxococcota bacterium]|nr:hypothetical protein [Myxococcota bacterium]